MPLRTRLTERFGLRHPILNAPTAGSGGGMLARAVSAGGGLGMIGGGFGDPDWLAQQFALAGDAKVGCGFITWALASKPHILDMVLDRYRPVAIFLSFGDPTPFAAAIRAAGRPMICQVQNLAQARVALAAGAAAIVAQGSEAGGHGSVRATMTLVPEVADLLARESPETLLLGAGGIADGRGLAAVLALGADGGLLGTRFYASEECLAHPNQKALAVSRSGDQTVRGHEIDIAYGIDWPSEFTCRVLNNGFTARWHGRDDEHRAQAAELRPEYFAAAAAGRADEVAVVVGEAIGMMASVRPATEIVGEVADQAEQVLRRRTADIIR